MESKWVGRMCGTVPLALAVGFGTLTLPQSARAQEVDEGYIVNHLGPAAEDMQWAGVDGSADSSPVIIEIAQRWLIEPAFWVSVDEAQMLVRSARDDRELRERHAWLSNPTEQYPARGVVARFGVVRVALTCQQAQQKAHSAQRLADTLSRVSQLNGIGTGLVGVISQGATRFVAPMAFATMVTGFAASWASQLASGYRNAPCLAGGERWRFRPNVLRTSLSPGPSRIPPSLSWRRGWLSAALRTGLTCRPQAATYPSLSRLALGRSRWSSFRISPGGAGSRLVA